MARQIITKVWCDPCQAEGVEAEAEETPPITIGSLKPRVVALCERHAKEFYAPLRELLTELGQVTQDGQAPIPASRSTRRGPGDPERSGTWPCPDPSCPKHASPYNHKQSLRNHARQVHASTIPQLRQAFEGEGAEAEPELDLGVPEPDDAPAVTRTECDHCGKVYEWPETVRPATALGVHLAKSHGIAGTKRKGKPKR